MSKKTPSSPTAATNPSPRKSSVFARERPSGSRRRGRPFEPGNPGRPKGARNKTTVMLEQMFAGEAEEVGRMAIELAKEGRVGAVKMVLDRTCPPRKNRLPEGVELPAIVTAADTVKAMGAIMAAISTGALAFDEARDLAAVVESCRKTIELADIESRIEALEDLPAPDDRYGMPDDDFYAPSPGRSLTDGTEPRNE